MDNMIHNKLLCKKIGCDAYFTNKNKLTVALKI